MLVAATKLILPINVLELISHQPNDLQTHNKENKHIHLVLQATHFSEHNSTMMTSHFLQLLRGFLRLFPGFFKPGNIYI